MKVLVLALLLLCAPAYADVTTVVIQLSASALDDSRIQLTWADNAAVSYIYEVERSMDQQLWEVVTDTPMGVKTYTDTALTPATTYFYRVRAVVAGGCA